MRLIAGVDEVGRGSLIGQVYAAAVILNKTIDKKLLRYLTVRVKKLDLETNYFGKKEDSEKKESVKN